LSAEAYDRVLRRAIFDCCKWHTQVEDRPVLCPFPLLLPAGVWARLAGLAEDLAHEALAAERDLRRRPELHAGLGLPRALRRALRPHAGADAGGPEVRVMRFDFHWTAEGWRISEANTDVAGGYIEASGVTRLMAECFPGFRAPGDPAGALAAAVRGCVGSGGRVGLMHLTVYAEDRQIMLYLARRLAEHGVPTYLFNPRQLCPNGGGAGAACAEYAGPLGLVFRFFPAEWLPQLPARTGWEHVLTTGPTPVCNPVYAVLTQSKRFPLAWDRLRTPLPTWRALLPETRDPREVPSGGEDWVLKPALGHEGHNVGIRGVTDASAWGRIRRSARWAPGAWAAQRRFVSPALPTPEGALYPCLGVYVIDGRAAGAYGRVAPRPLIDDRSREIAVLLLPPNGEGSADDA
jgi:glutathionylspermidine synthase